MLYNISADPAGGKEFFERYARRIIYGTDCFSSLSPAETRARSGMVRRWLETDEEFRVAEEADFLLGKPEDGIIQGLGLGDTALGGTALGAIYRENFLRLAGDEPAPLDASRAAAECRRLADAARDGSEARKAANVLSEGVVRP